MEEINPDCVIPIFYMIEDIENDKNVVCDVNTDVSGISLDNISPPQTTASVKLEQVEQQPYSEQSKPDRIPCKECKYTAINEEKLLCHVRKVHLKVNPYQCTQCDYTTDLKPEYTEHARLKHGINPFKCSQCPYSTPHKNSLTTHEQTHVPRNPLKCPECPIIALNSLDLYRLRRTHLFNPGVLTCKLCNSVFQNSKELDGHKKLCDECKKKFCPTVYDKHVSRHAEMNNRKLRVFFECAICKWSGTSRLKIMLHLIHHPSQEVPYGVDVSVLRKCGIRVGEPLKRSAKRKE